MTNADGTVTTIAFPAGSVPEDMTIVVTPLSEPTTDRGDPLTPGVLVEQKGNEGQHLQLASPAIVTFALKGKVPDEAAVVTFTDPETAQPLASSISKQGKTTMVTAFVPSFSDTTVDGDPGAWGDLAPLVPDYRFAGRERHGYAERPAGGDDLERRWHAHVPALTGKFAFNGMSGPPGHAHHGLDRSRTRRRLARQHQAQGRGQARRLLGPGGEQEEGHLLGARQRQPVRQRIGGDRAGNARGPTMSEGHHGAVASDARIGVKASGVPAKVGGSVPATFTIYGRDTAWQYKSTLTWVRSDGRRVADQSRARRRDARGCGQAAAMASGRVRSSLMMRPAISASRGRAARAKRMPRSSSCS